MSNKFLSGKIIDQGYYKAFIPNEINRKWEIDDMSVITLLSQADRHLGRLDMYSEYVNIDLYISCTLPRGDAIVHIEDPNTCGGSISCKDEIC